MGHSVGHIVPMLLKLKPVVCLAASSDGSTNAFSTFRLFGFRFSMKSLLPASGVDFHKQAFIQPHFGGYFAPGYDGF